MSNPAEEFEIMFEKTKGEICNKLFTELTMWQKLRALDAIWGEEDINTLTEQAIEAEKDETKHYSNAIFGKNYEALTTEEKMKVDNMIEAEAEEDPLELSKADKERGLMAEAEDE